MNTFINIEFFPEGIKEVDLNQIVKDLEAGKLVRNDSSNSNPLMWACQHDLVDYAKIFLKYYDVNALSFNNEHALQIACANNSEECISLLMTKDVSSINKKEAFLVACKAGCLKSMELLIEEVTLYDNRMTHYPFLSGIWIKRIPNVLQASETDSFIKLVSKSRNKQAIYFVNNWLTTHPEKVAQTSYVAMAS